MTAALLSMAEATLSAAAPILLAALGALTSEYAGVLAVFMDGAMTLAGFTAIAVTSLTGHPLAGLAAAAVSTVTLMYGVSLFTERTGANPFLTGLGVNFLSQGLTSLLSVTLFGTRGVIPLDAAALVLPLPRGWPVTAAAFLTVPLIAFLLYRTVPGINLRVSGSDPDLLESRGISSARYRTLSWCVAALFASLAGSLLAFDLGAFTPALSAGRGWTALAAVYLGYRKPFTVALAVLVFAAANSLANALQGSLPVPATVLLGLPYALALAAFALAPQRIAPRGEKA